MRSLTRSVRQPRFMGPMIPPKLSRMDLLASAEKLRNSQLLSPTTQLHLRRMQLLFRAEQLLSRKMQLLSRKMQLLFPKMQLLLRKMQLLFSRNKLHIGDRGGGERFLLDRQQNPDKTARKNL